MKFFSFLLLFTFYFVTIVSCRPQAKQKLQPEIAYCDSAVIMYYDKPGEPRFYKMTRVYEKNFIIAVNGAVNDKVIKAKDTCTTQGKIYFYGEKGAVYIVYFSRLNDCMTLSFIKTGEKYFTRMTKEVKQMLEEQEKSAIVPAQAN